MDDLSKMCFLDWEKFGEGKKDCKNISIICPRTFMPRN